MLSDHAVIRTMDPRASWYRHFHVRQSNFTQPYMPTIILGSIIVCILIPLGSPTENSERPSAEIELGTSAPRKQSLADRVSDSLLADEPDSLLADAPDTDKVDGLVTDALNVAGRCIGAEVSGPRPSLQTQVCILSSWSANSCNCRQ